MGGSSLVGAGAGSLSLNLAQAQEEGCNSRSDGFDGGEAADTRLCCFAAWGTLCEL